MKYKNPYHAARFIKSAAKLSQLPPDHGIEIAFAGRSNAGKSSALNKLTEQAKLARVSKTPGRTQLINLFSVDENDERRLVDLPGYGYAKVAQQLKHEWQAVLSDYLQTRQSIRGLILLMDIRHPLTALDQQMAYWLMDRQLPTHILLTKADKLKRYQINEIIKKLKNELDPALFTIQPFSSLTGLGLDELKSKLDEWFLFNNN